MTPRAARRPRWVLVLAAVYIALNLIAIPFSIAFGPHLDDWQLWASLPEKVLRGDVYTPDEHLPFVWSPVAAWLMAGVSLVGYWPWVVAHFAVVPLLRKPGLILFTLTSWAFWWDTASAHTMTFVLVAGVLALRGSRLASLAYLALFLLMPRPIQLPLAVWLLWKQPSVRLPFAGVFVAHGLLVLATGLGADWIGALVDFGALEGLGIGPGRYIGAAWLIVGLPLAAFLLWRGWPGWSGLALSPYVLPQYLLMPLADLTQHDRRGGRVSSEG